MYDKACDDCEHKVVLNEAQRIKVRSNLIWDRRKRGSHGRALIKDIPELGLLKGDRVEPTDTMEDIAALDDAPTPLA
eukprot:13295026-Alexandrium_andersonii.AAC.1